VETAEIVVEDSAVAVEADSVAAVEVAEADTEETIKITKAETKEVIKQEINISQALPNKRKKNFNNPFAKFKNLKDTKNVEK